MPEVRRGELWWTNLPEPFGSEPGFRRPALIVQADRFNRSSIRTYLAAIVTSNLHLARAPGNVLLSPEISGLSQPSVVNVSQLVTADIARLSEYIDTLPEHVMRDVDTGLRLVLDL